METNLIGEMDMLREMGVRPSFSEMARRYGMDRHTVAKYWKEGAGMEDGRSARRSGFDRYRDEIEDRAQIPGVTMKAIHEWLLDRHPDVKLPKYGASRHWMDARGLKAGQPLPDAHPRYETEPGRQLRSDWKERLLLHGRDGAEFLSSVWSATLGYPGRHIYIRSNTITTDDFVGCAYQTAQRLGGVPPERIADNMSALVTTGSGGKRHRVERAFAFAGRMGFRTGLCAARTPQTKGKDESANRFASRLPAHGRDVGGWEDIDAAIARIEARSNEEPNEDTGMPPAALFMKEKDLLKPVPSASEALPLLGEVSRQRVPSTMLVGYAGREWSVPRRCIGRTVRLVGMPGGELRTCLGNELVAVHDTAASQQSIDCQERHYIEALGDRRWATDGDIEEAARRNLELLGNLGKER
ncbi:MAG: IS21 family transposase [Atopobium sp.]|nr:IS21 family transposase [Atopobium sp.]